MGMYFTKIENEFHFIEGDASKKPYWGRLKNGEVPLPTVANKNEGKCTQFFHKNVSHKNIVIIHLTPNDFITLVSPFPLFKKDH